MRSRSRSTRMASPWWICPCRRVTIGLFGGTTIERVVMVQRHHRRDAQDLAIDDVPRVGRPRAIRQSCLSSSTTGRATYQDGWLNSLPGPGGRGAAPRRAPTATLGYNYIAKDDDVWVYTGVTSATADNSIVGFVLVNQRTAESHLLQRWRAPPRNRPCSRPRAQVQNLRYSSTFPHADQRVRASRPTSWP